MKRDSLSKVKIVAFASTALDTKDFFGVSAHLTVPQGAALPEPNWTVQHGDAVDDLSDVDSNEFTVSDRGVNYHGVKRFVKISASTGTVTYVVFPDDIP